MRSEGILDTDWTLDDDVGDVIGAAGCNDGMLLVDDERLGSSIGGTGLLAPVLDRSGCNVSLWKVTDLRFPALSERIRLTIGRILGIGGWSLGMDSECHDVRRLRVVACCGFVEGAETASLTVGRNISGSKVISFALKLPLPVLL